MKLGELAAASGIDGLNERFGPQAEQTAIAGITADSRQVAPGYLFVALKGTAADGAAYISQAIEKGAAAVLIHEGAGQEALPVPVARLEDPRQALSRLAAAFYAGQPETMVAVTGTAGKTSVASFVRQIWEGTGKSAASIGTTGVTAPGREEYGSLTTPDPVALHALLAELAGAGVTHCSMEASSHGLDQFRLDGVRLAAGAFTNLGRDHMDYHPTVDHYFDAKMRLFGDLLSPGSPAIIFADDPWSEKAVAAAKAAGQTVLTVGRAGSYISLKRVEHERFGQVAEIHHEGRHYRVPFPLAGDFQIANALVAAGLAISTGSEPQAVMHELEKLKGASGRLELVGYSASHAPCYVDYAHKPDALENVLASLRPFTTGKLVCVFGCGGDRDPGKRPIMGEIASRLADSVIVTDDNPRSEEPAAIRAAIMAAAKGAKEIGDRAQAINEAVSMLGKGDCLVVAGKGHETGQTVGETTHPFSDHEVLRNALTAAGGKAA
ncbi:UDP-N-acetylmuramoyl-L-alanyl-D-glutamate--2,6-diaminopimelate ligase [Salaquimonas pukyongi]|uniref:UDP-N-acetylmuramoyl-L-alanyl-D-glutamate--2, 6-diaminopimelate ligase n=1 Tax=Salaquimonas pukyongi TaxID=2712698 RepID=UPI00096B8B21|nr:UDP-N-acetylmuramoyl-L-alanyl-D-glutamate--2,6-diaminopimelate ligase [Salaquimonas pukyongi]